MAGYNYISREGYEKLKKELKELKEIKRPEIAQKISEARDFGDLKENAEYHAAKEAMALLESRIAQLEETLRKSKVLDAKDLSGEQVSIYTTVRLRDLVRNTELEYTLVAPQESDFKQKKISSTSPVGKGLLGKKVGDVVEIKVPAGVLKYEILDIKVSI